jgi:outer membrane protein assembly factor BamB
MLTIFTKFRLMAANVAVLSLFVTNSALASDPSGWASFRGNHQDAYAPQGAIPDEWSTSDYAWRLNLPGRGDGSMAIFDGRVYLQNAEPEASRRSVVAVDLQTGKIVWQQFAELENHSLHARNTFASSTPFVDASGIYVAWADPSRVTLAALEHDGRLRWERDLGPWQSQHGFAASPVIHGGKVILFNSQQAEQLEAGQVAGQSRMMAFDPNTGESLWQTDMTTTRVCYGVPNLYQPKDGPPQLIGANTGDGLFGIDLETGKMLWNLRVFNARSVSSPLVVGDLVMGTAGSGGGGRHLVAVRPGSAEDQREPEQVYRLDRFAPYVPTPAVANGRLYIVDDTGIASCVNASDGEVLWFGRVGGTVGASPVVIGDKILTINLEGQATVLAAGDRFQPLATFSLGGPVQATPAYADGSLLLRIGNTICCLAAKPI